MASKPNHLGSQDWKQLGCTFLDLLSAFLLTFGATHLVPMVEGLDNAWATLAATALTFLIQAIRRFLSDTRPTVEERLETEKQGVKPK